MIFLCWTWRWMGRERERVWEQSAKRDDWMRNISAIENNVLQFVVAGHELRPRDNSMKAEPNADRQQERRVCIIRKIESKDKNRSATNSNPSSYKNIYSKETKTLQFSFVYAYDTQTGYNDLMRLHASIFPVRLIPALISYLLLLLAAAVVVVSTSSLSLLLST